MQLKDVIDLGMGKIDIYKALTKKGQLYLPPFSMCNFRYFEGLLTGKKSAFTSKEITIAYVPLYPELSVAKVYELALKVPKVLQYLPDFDKPDAKKLSRTFLFNVMNTIDPNFFAKAVNEIEEGKFKSVVRVDPSISINAKMLLMLK